MFKPPLLGTPLVPLNINKCFWEIPYGHVNSTPCNQDSAWGKPSEIQNLSMEIGSVAPWRLNGAWCREGWAVGGSGVIYQTKDGGKHV